MIFSGLHALLIFLNIFLLYCAIKGVLRPHFEIMFVMSSILTALYSWFILKIEEEELRVEEEKRGEAVRKAQEKIEEVRKGKKGKKGRRKKGEAIEGEGEAIEGEGEVNNGGEK